MTDILESMQPLHDFLTKPNIVRSILLDRSLKMIGKTSRFIEAGDKVKLDNGELVDCLDGIPTHEVVACHGTPYCDFSLDLINLETDNTITIKI